MSPGTKGDGAMRRVLMAVLALALAANAGPARADDKQT
jgi:hypothetical protein